MGGGENVNGLVISNICPSLLLLNGHCAFNYIICQKPFKSNPKEPRYPEKRGLPNFGICAGSIEILWYNLFNLSQLIKTFEMALLGLPSALEPLCAPLNFFLENSHKLDQVINTDYSFILLINLLINRVTEWLGCKCFTNLVLDTFLQIVVMGNFLNLVGPDKSLQNFQTLLCKFWNCCSRYAFGISDKLFWN